MTCTEQLWKILGVDEADAVECDTTEGLLKCYLFLDSRVAEIA